MTFEFVSMALFFASAFAVLYTYVGYPLLVYGISVIFPKPVRCSAFEPDVTVLITAYNEENSIGEKIENTLAIDYPKHKFEIIVASDGSSDKTDEIVRKFESRGVRLFRQEGRKGKTHTQNGAVEKAKGEIILFSDATTDYQPDVVKKLMPFFADSSIGCATGKLVYVDPTDSDVGKGAQSYWNYETFLKQSESSACSLIGASGCLYAVRKSAYQPMYPEACSDFLICTVLYRQGFRSVFVPEAVCFEETNSRSSNELKMRIRVISQTFTDLWRNKSMMNPFISGFYSVQLVSHKLFRYMVPWFLLVMLLSSILLSLSSFIFGIFALLQILFYALCLVAWRLEKSRFRSGPMSVILYFLIANYASAAGFYKFIIGERYSSWEPIRDEAGAGDKA